MTTFVKYIKEGRTEGDGKSNKMMSSRDLTYHFRISVSRSVRPEFDKTLHFGWTTTLMGFVAALIVQLRASKRIDVNQTLQRARTCKRIRTYVERRDAKIYVRHAHRVEQMQRAPRRSLQVSYILETSTRIEQNVTFHPLRK